MDVTKLEVGDILQISDYSYGCVIKIDGETYDEMIVTVYTVYIPNKGENGEVPFVSIEEPSLKSELYDKMKIHDSTQDLPRSVRPYIRGARRVAIALHRE